MYDIIYITKGDDTMQYYEILENVDKKDVKAYAKGLLEAERACWECDPILIEEYWSEEVHDFLNFLANNY